MAFPELYRYGREGRYFGIRLFVVYMLDGIYQVGSSVLRDATLH